MKKNWAISSLLLVSTSLSAGGFYAGVSGGYQSLVNTKGGISNQFAGDSDVSTYILENYFFSKTEASGILGSLFLGYEKSVTKHLFLAAEFNAEAMSNHIKQYDAAQLVHDGIPQITVLGGEVNASEDLALGITVRPGLLLQNNARLYGVLGYEAGRFNVSDHYNLQLPLSLLVYSATTGHQWINGFRYGVGSQFDVNERLAVRLEFNQTQYAKKNTGPYIDVNTGLPGAESLAFKLRTSATNLGLIYKFDQPAPAFIK